MDLKTKISKILLPAVQHPAQYIGGEINQINKPWNPAHVNVALAFPDTYAIGMSHLGLAILYEAVNQLPNARAERVFAPWLDARDVMQRNQIPLFTWESRRPLTDFDIVGFTLQHELAFTNILYMLDLAGIPFRAEDRSDAHPLIFAGGPIADSSEPVADFFDAILLGDGEQAFPQLLSAYAALKRQASRSDILHQLARQFDYLYVPQFYQPCYNSDNTLQSCLPIYDDIPDCVSRAEVPDLDAAVFPTAPLLPNTDIIHNRIAIEIMRGCPQRCAFCHAAHTKGKLRCRSIDRIVDIAQRAQRATGHDTISLLSLSTSDYPQLPELVRRLYDAFQGQHVSLSLPSLRVDKTLYELPPQVTSVRREGLTVAVEASSHRLRLAIGKKITDEDLLATMDAAFRAGWQKVKLYFMAALPYETPDELLGILDLAAAVSRLGKPIHGTPVAVSAAISWFVPKPHTPLAWAPQADLDYFRQTRRTLIAAKRQIKGACVNLKFHHMERSFLEAVFARGDRRLSRVIEAAYKLGSCFDSWDECFRYDNYIQAFEQTNIDPAFYANRPRSGCECLPWDHLAGVPHKTALLTRWQNIQKLLT